MESERIGDGAKGVLSRRQRSGWQQAAVLIVCQQLIHRLRPIQDFVFLLGYAYWAVNRLSVLSPEQCAKLVDRFQTKLSEQYPFFATVKRTGILECTIRNRMIEFLLDEHMDLPVIIQQSKPAPSQSANLPSGGLQPSSSDGQLRGPSGQILTVTEGSKRQQ